VRYAEQAEKMRVAGTGKAHFMEAGSPSGALLRPCLTTGLQR
jgi:hypothetical protein